MAVPNKTRAMLEGLVKDGSFRRLLAGRLHTMKNWKRWGGLHLMGGIG